MVDVSQELMDFSYRELSVDMQSIFPRLDIESVRQKFSHLKVNNLHQTAFNVSRELANGGYDWIFDNFGFHEAEYQTFSGHCHQCTPALGLVLKTLGFEKISYLECFRIREHFPQTGILEQVPPTEEPNPAMKDEFCSIGRIPYCCLEVFIDGRPFYITGKHIRQNGENVVALLTTVCYLDALGVFPHQENPLKSGIYLKTITPTSNPMNMDFSKRIVWMKQTSKDPQPEYFATFLRMELI